MQLPQSRAVRWAIGVSCVLAVLSYLGYNGLTRRFDDRVYRIGWQQVPPFQERSADGSPAGLAVEVVQDAARRRKVRLEWIFYPGSSEAALRNGEVDLWPLMVITPERQKIVHISRPYLQHDSILLVRAGSSYRKVQQLAEGVISQFDLPIHRRLLEKVLPKARVLGAASYRDAIGDVCANRADAAFMDEFTAGTISLGGLPCSGEPLRTISMPMLQTQLGIGSTLAAGKVADEVRRGIDDSTNDGTLATIMTEWGYLAPRIDYVSALIEARGREQRLIATVAGIGVLLLFTLLGANRMRRQRDRIQSAEVALRKSDQEIRLLANNLSEMVLAYDMDRRLIYANPASTQLTGYSLAELKNLEFPSLIHPEDRASLLEQWARLFQGDRCQPELRIITKGGKIKWVATTIGPIEDGEGRQVGVEGSARDITEAKLAAEGLRESEHRFRELLERIHLVALMIDADGAISFCNDHFLAITGWSRDEVIGRPGQELLDPESLRELTHAFGPSVQSFQGSIQSKDGSKRRIRWSRTPLRDTAGRETLFASLGEDVTELEILREEAARREGEERFQNIADTSPLMIWVVDADARCTFVNREWLSFTGEQMEQVLGMGWSNGIHPDDLESCLAQYMAAFAERRRYQVEHRFRRNDGEYSWVLCSGIPSYGPDGEFTGYVGTCTDISDLKRSRDEDMARQKVESVGTLAGGVAHEFNNLLAGLLSQADVALAEISSGFQPEEQLKNIRAVALRGAGVVRQLMIYAGHESSTPETVELSQLIGDMRELLQVAVSKHAVLKTDLARGLPGVRANPAQLRQMIMNLATNASEAIGRNDGVITIRTSHVGGADQAAENSAGFIELEVSDTGLGMSPEVSAKIFDPFFTTKSAGQGLGLAVVQLIVREMGGSIDLESTPGSGTTFRIRLPAYTEASVTLSPSPASPARDESARPGIVLMVDDEDALRQAAAKMLRMQQFNVLEAGDGNEALALLREHREAIAVLLLDISLPGASSHEVFAESRSICPGVKVIVSTAYGRCKAEQSFPGMQFDGFIPKPYRLADLIRLVQDLLPQVPKK